MTKFAKCFLSGLLGLVWYGVIILFFAKVCVSELGGRHFGRIYVESADLSIGLFNKPKVRLRGVRYAQLFVVKKVDIFPLEHKKQIIFNGVKPIFSAQQYIDCIKGPLAAKLHMLIPEDVHGYVSLPSMFNAQAYAVNPVKVMIFSDSLGNGALEFRINDGLFGKFSSRFGYGAFAGDWSKVQCKYTRTSNGKPSTGELVFSTVPEPTLSITEEGLEFSYSSTEGYFLQLRNFQLHTLEGTLQEMFGFSTPRLDGACDLRLAASTACNQTAYTKPSKPEKPRITKRSHQKHATSRLANKALPTVNLPAVKKMDKPLSWVVVPPSLAAKGAASAGDSPNVIESESVKKPAQEVEEEVETEEVGLLEKAVKPDSKPVEENTTPAPSGLAGLIKQFQLDVSAKKASINKYELQDFSISACFIPGQAMPVDRVIIKNVKGLITLASGDKVCVSKCQATFAYHPDSFTNLYTMAKSLERLSAYGTFNGSDVQIEKGPSNRIRYSDLLTATYSVEKDGVRLQNGNAPKVGLYNCKAFVPWQAMRGKSFVDLQAMRGKSFVDLQALHSITLSGEAENTAFFAQKRVPFESKININYPSIMAVSKLHGKAQFGSIDVRYDFVSKLGRADLTGLRFDLPACLGEKRQGSRFHVFFDLASKTVAITSDELVSSVSTNSQGVHANCMVKTLENDFDFKVEYKFAEKLIKVDGNGARLDGRPWLKKDTSDDEPLPSMSVNLEVGKLKVSNGGYLCDANIKVDNTGKGESADVIIEGDAAFGDKGKEERKEKVSIRIHGDIPNRKITVKSDDAHALAKIFSVDLPIVSGKALLEGYVHKHRVEGNVTINGLYTTKGLGLLGFVRLFSVGHWLNMLLQPNTNYWPQVKANWAYYPGEKLTISDFEMRNLHYAIFANGSVDLKAEKVDIDGQLVPQTIWQRLIMSNLNSKAGMSFKVFGPYDNVQTTVKSSAQILPFFLP